MSRTKTQNNLSDSFIRGNCGNPVGFAISGIRSRNHFPVCLNNFVDFTTGERRPNSRDLMEPTGIIHAEYLIQGLMHNAKGDTSWI